MEEAAGRGSGHERGAFCAAAGLAKDEDAGWVATKFGDVVADPLEGEDEVELADVSGCGILGREIAKVEIAEGVEPVVDCDDNDIAAMDQPRAVIEVARDSSIVVGSAVEVDEDGTAGVVAQACCPDIEVQTIFALDAYVAGDARGQLRAGARGAV